MVVVKKYQYCSSCKKNKNISYFYASSKSGDWCKSCRVEYNDSRRYGANREKELRQRRNRHYIRTYGITIDHYESLLREQDGVCGICKTRKKLSLAVDHNHTTGAVRGLLCNNCNTAIGNFMENKEILFSAIKYLEKYE